MRRFLLLSLLLASTLVDAIEVRSVRLQAPATNITQDYTVASFGTVQASIVVAGGAGTDGTDVDELRQSFGFWDDTNTVSWSTHFEHGVAIASAATRSDQDASNIVEMITGGVGTERSATISAVTDGIRLTWAGSDLTNRPFVIVTLINDINGAQAGADTPNASDAGTSVVTTTGITPKVIFAGQNRRNVADGAAAWATASFGFAFDNGVTIEQLSLAWNMVNGISSGQLIVDSDRISTNSGASQVDTQQEITAMASGSFTQTTRNVTGSGAEESDLFYLALDYDEDATTFSSAVPTATGDWSPLTGGSFTPSSTIILPSFRVTLDSLTTGNESGFFGFYIADGTNEYQLGWNHEDAATPNSNTSGRTDQKVWNTDDTAGTADFDASSPTFGSGTITYADANVTEGSQASFVIGIALEAASGIAPLAAAYYEGMQ